MKRSIDIEKLLQWAVRDELPKGSAVTDDIGGIIARRFRRREPGGIAASLRRSPDTTSVCMGFVPGAPHQDALRVCDALHAISDFARLTERAEVMPLFGNLAGIAGEAVDAILAASFNPRSLVISMATQSMRPRWQFEQPTPARMMLPYRDAAGAMRERPLVHGTDAAGDIVYLQPGRTAKARGVYDLAMSPRSPINWHSPSMITVGHARAEYFAWHSALVQLARALAGQLAEYEPMPPAVRPMPWLTGQAPASRVLSDGKPPISLVMPVQPKRSAPARPLESDIARDQRLARAQWTRELRQKMLAEQGVT